MHREFKNIKKQGLHIIIEEFVNFGNIAVRYYAATSFDEKPNDTALICLVTQRASKTPKYMSYCCLTGKQINRRESKMTLYQSDIINDDFHNENIQWALEANYIKEESKRKLVRLGFKQIERDIFSDWQPSMQQR